MSRWVAVLIVGIIPNCLYQFNARGIICFRHGFKEALLLGQGSQAKQLLVLGFSVTTDCASGPLQRGAAFEASGAILQRGITRNPLADTGILGINAGAGLAVILFISFC